jgi:hypothetical protein
MDLKTELDNFVSNPSKLSSKNYLRNSKTYKTLYLCIFVPNYI